MSDAAVSEQPDLSTPISSPRPKRKRDTVSPGTRLKRIAPHAAMTPDTAAFIENAIEATQAAAVAATAAVNGVSVADFNALQQAAAADPAHDADTSSDPSEATSTARAALSMYPTLHVPASTEEQFASQAAGEVEQQQQTPSPHAHDPTYHPENDALESSTVSQQVSNGAQSSNNRYHTGAKPSVGSDAWHKMRKDNHKEVERRRRETINEGINELAKIVPGCEKNKGSILQRAVSFISQLKENEQQNIEKWTLEKLLTEQAITELSGSNDKLKQECERLYRELEIWKRVAQNAGLEAPQLKEPEKKGEKEITASPDT